jgi:hypothetical protein
MQLSGLSYAEFWVLSRGIIAWTMANRSLSAIDSGVADPAQRKNIVTGRLCGIIGIGIAISMAALGYYAAISVGR